MKARAAEPIESQITTADYLLSGFAAALAAYSAGMGVSSPGIGWFFVFGIVIGTIASMLLHRPLAAGAGRADGWLYAVLAIVAIASTNELNALLPDDGFSRPLLIANALCWMMLLGSFSLWSDSTLLFQAVPSIALFGLVGCWDTYSNSTILFFVFLLCVATLFARAHRRVMLARAAASGFAGLDMQRHELAGNLGKANQRLKEGPWRWMAGPEWGLASAAVIIVLSLLGAPVIQSSVKDISGFVRIQVPQSRALPGNPLGLASESDSVRVGQGPTSLSQTPVLTAELSVPMYLRTQTYNVYNGRGWTRRSSAADAGDQWEGQSGDRFEVPVQGFQQRARRLNSRIEDFRISLLTPLDSLPVPGEVIGLDVERSKFRPRSDGTVGILNRNEPVRDVAGRALIAQGTPTKVPDAPPSGLTPSYETAGIDPQVRALAQDVAADAETDYEKAMAVKREIERRVRYNLKAPAVPADRDPVATVLFDTQEGYCDLFASAMVQMARSVGIPARYVIGYYPTTGQRDEQGRYVVLQADYHAWAELFFEGHGWVVFDATEGATQVEGAGRGEAVDNRPWHEQLWASAIFVLAGLAVVGGIGRVLWFKYGAKLLPPPKPREEIRRLYRGFVRSIRDATDVPKRLSQTPSEYLEVVRPKLGERFASAQSLNRELERALYGRDEPTPDAVAQWRESLRRWSKGRP